VRKISWKEKRLGYHRPYFATNFIDPAIRKFSTPLKVQPSIKEKRYGLDYEGGFISRLSLWGKQSGHVGVVSLIWVSVITSVITSVIFHSSFARSSVRLYKKPEVKFKYTSYQTKHSKI
jgi:hypothetical protein